MSIGFCIFYARDSILVLFCFVLKSLLLCVLIRKKIIVGLCEAHNLIISLTLLGLVKVIIPHIYTNSHTNN